MKCEPSNTLITWIIFTNGTTSAQVPLYEPQLELVNNRFELISPGKYFADQISCSHDGLMFRGEKGFFIYKPAAYWQDFLRSKALKEFEYTGLNAVAFFKEFDRWAKDKTAAYALWGLEHGQLTFADLENLAPDLKDHPVIQKKAAYCLFLDAIPKRKGKRKTGTNQPLAVHALIQWVSVYRSVDGLSLEAAVEKALTNHHELIPAQWSDPDGSLAKAYKRNKEQYD